MVQNDFNAEDILQVCHFLLKRKNVRTATYDLKASFFEEEVPSIREGMEQYPDDFEVVDRLDFGPDVPADFRREATLLRCLHCTDRPYLKSLFKSEIRQHRRRHDEERKPEDRERNPKISEDREPKFWRAPLRSASAAASAPASASVPPATEIDLPLEGSADRAELFREKILPLAISKTGFTFRGVEFFLRCINFGV